jgi:signal transduction histidine kinase
MYQQTKQPEPRSSLLANLLHLVQSTFHNTKLYGFTYQSKDNSTWSFGKNITLIAGIAPLDDQYGSQFSDVVYKDKPFKMFDLPLQDGSSFFFFFEPNHNVEEDIFATIRFQRLYETTAYQDQGLFLEIYALEQQIFKYNDIPDYLLNIFDLHNVIVWKEDHEIQNIRRQIGLPFEQFNLCHSVLKVASDNTIKMVINNTIAQSADGKKIYGLTLQDAQDLSFLASLPYPTAIIDQHFLMHAVNRPWHDILQRTCISLRTFIPKSNMLKLEQAFDRKPFTFQATLRFAPDILMDWHIHPFGKRFILTGTPQKTHTCTLQHMQSLEEHNLLLKQFAHLCAHDLKEPLRAISSYVQLLLRKPEKQEQYAGFIVNSCHSLKDLIDGILAYSTCEADTVEPKLLNMNDIIDTALIYLQEKIDEKQAVIKWDPHTPIHIKGNKAQLVQVFQNIIDNALKFSVDVPIIHIAHRIQNGRHLFMIRDFGIGIPEHLVRKAFNLFTRLNDKGKFSGSGIGLALCKKIIEFHKGALTIIPQTPGIEVQIVL